MRAARVCAALWLLGALHGCDGCGAAETSAPAEETEVVVDVESTLGLPPDVAARVVARIDDEELTLLDVAYELESLSPILAGRASDAEGRRALVERLVMDRALAAEARARGLEDTTSVRFTREELLVRALVAQAEHDVPAPSEEEIASFYALHRDRYRAPELRTAGLIFTRDRPAAEAALAALLAEQRRLPELWMSTAERIGFAGPRMQPRVETELLAREAREGEPFVPQVVREAVFATTPGTVYAELVPYEDGVYLVRVSERADPTDTPLESVRAGIAAELLARAIDAHVTSLVALALTQAQFDEDALTSVEIAEPAASAPAATP